MTTAVPTAVMPTTILSAYRPIPVPTGPELHMMSRLGCGFSPTTWRQLTALGGAQQWFERQLEADLLVDNTKAAALPRWFPDLAESPGTKWSRDASGAKRAYKYALDLANLTLLRRVYSDHQVHETLVDLWSNHLNVPNGSGTHFVHRASYDAVIRQHALGRFDDMLVAATLHPAMQMYLDNFRSTRGAPNENHGRELLELHTVGRASGYTEDMVKDSAKILSGYTVDVRGTWKGYYDPNRHTTGAVRVLDFARANTSADGSAMTVEYLRYLAHHPATANTIVRKLAVRFVCDEPSQELLDQLAAVYLSSGTDIRATLRALVASPDFARSVGQKVRTPIEDLVATIRAVGINIPRPYTAGAFANRLAYLPQSMVVYSWAPPDGPPDRNSAWASPTRMLSSFRMHLCLAGGWTQTKPLVPAPATWLPKKRCTLDQLVDHMSRRMLGRPATPLLMSAAATAVQLNRTSIIDATVISRSRRFLMIAETLLDTPTHMSR